MKDIQKSTLRSNVDCQTPGFHLVVGGWGATVPPWKLYYQNSLDVDECLTKCMSSESMHM